jgi:hypothetical protein
MERSNTGRRRGKQRQGWEIREEAATEEPEGEAGLEEAEEGEVTQFQPGHTSVGAPGTNLRRMRGRVSAMGNLPTYHASAEPALLMSVEQVRSDESLGDAMGRYGHSSGRGHRLAGTAMVTVCSRNGVTG